MYVWPYRTLIPLRQRTYRTGGAKLGPISIDGAQQQSSRTDGGGLWRSDCQFAIITPDQIRCARAWSNYLDGGVTEFIFPLLDLAFAPRPIFFGKPQKQTIPPEPADYFSTEIGWGSKLINAELKTTAARRATSITATILQGSSPKGGENFTISHDDLGNRLYRIGRIASEDGDDFTFEIRPPLRDEVTVTGDPKPNLNFDMPSCVMKLHPDSANALDIAVSLLRLGETVDVSFIESITL